MITYNIISRRLLPVLVGLVLISASCSRADSALEQMIPAEATAIVRFDVPNMIKAAGLDKSDRPELPPVLQKAIDSADDSPIAKLLTDLPALGLDLKSSAYAFTTDKTFGVVALASLSDEQAAVRTLEARIGGKFESTDGLNCLYREDTFCAIDNGTLFVATMAKPIEREKAAAAAKRMLNKQQSGINTDTEVGDVLHRDDFAINAFLRTSGLKNSAATSTSSSPFDVIADSDVRALTLGIAMKEHEVGLTVNLIADKDGDYVRLVNTVVSKPDSAFLAVMPNSMEVIGAVSVNGKAVCELPIVKQYVDQVKGFLSLGGIDLPAILGSINGPVAFGVARDPHLKGEFNGVVAVKFNNATDIIAQLSRFGTQMGQAPEIYDGEYVYEYSNKMIRLGNRSDVLYLKMLDYEQTEGYADSDNALGKVFAGSAAGLAVTLPPYGRFAIGMEDACHGSGQFTPQDPEANATIQLLAAICSLQNIGGAEGTSSPM